MVSSSGNGAVVGEASPGLGFKVPVIDSVVDMSVQTEKVQFDNIQAFSRDIQQADVAASVNVRLAPDRVLDSIPRSAPATARSCCSRSCKSALRKSSGNTRRRK